MPLSWRKVQNYAEMGGPIHLSEGHWPPVTCFMCKIWIFAAISSTLTERDEGSGQRSVALIERDFDGASPVHDQN